MSERANYVIIRDGVAKAYYAPWGALSCLYVFASGPVEASICASIYPEDSRLLRWDIADAGYLIDFDQKRAIVFGSTYSNPEEIERNEKIIRELELINCAFKTSPMKYLQCIAPQWSGWLISWDSRCIDAFSTYLQQNGIDTISYDPPFQPPIFQRIQGHPADEEIVCFQA